jgi:hypothetical protein
MIGNLGNIVRAALAAGLVAVASPGAAQPFSFAAIGDMPYFLPADYQRFEKLIAEINRRAPAFTIHVGDIKSGSTRCTDETFTTIAGYFATFEAPLIYTPGDNEWTDCHRANNGGFDPLERLAKIRSLFFPDDMSLGRKRLKLAQQSADPKFRKFVENARWTHNNVTFATLHIIGSNNNLQRNRAAVEEYLERNDANLAWLEASFAEARTQNRAALVLSIQANPHFEKHPDEKSGFNDFLAVLERETLAFGKPVLLIHGDTHYFRIDQPLTVGPQKRRADNFIRLEVYGERDVHGVLVSVDAADGVSPFTFRPILVRENFNDLRRPN